MHAHTRMHVQMKGEAELRQESRVLRRSKPDSAGNVRSSCTSGTKGFEWRHVLRKLARTLLPSEQPQGTLFQASQRDFSQVFAKSSIKALLVLSTCTYNNSPQHLLTRIAGFAHSHPCFCSGARTHFRGIAVTTIEHYFEIPKSNTGKFPYS